MTTFLIIVLVGVNIGQFLNNGDLKRELRGRRHEFSLDTIRFGVTPEGLENAAHRRTEFPTLR